MFEDILKELLVISSCQFPTIIHSLLLHLDSQVYRRNPDNKTHRPMIYINGNIYDYPSNLFVRGIGRSYHPRASGVGLGLNHPFKPTSRYRYLYIYKLFLHQYTPYMHYNLLYHILLHHTPYPQYQTSISIPREGTQLNN